MIVVCVLGWVLALSAGFVLGAEVVSFAGTGKYHIIAAGELWFDLHSRSLNLSQAVIQRYLHPWLWEPAMNQIFQLEGIEKSPPARRIPAAERRAITLKPFKQLPWA